MQEASGLQPAQGEDWQQPVCQGWLCACASFPLGPGPHESKCVCWRMWVIGRSRLGTLLSSLAFLDSCLYFLLSTESAVAEGVFMMVWACPRFHLRVRNRRKCPVLAAHMGIKNTRTQQDSHSSVPGRWLKTDVMHCNPRWRQEDQESGVQG